MAKAPTKTKTPKSAQPAQAAPAKTAATPQGIMTVVQTGKIHEVKVTEGLTARKAIEKAGMAVTRQTKVMLNGKACADLDVTLKANDQVMLVGEVAGAHS